MDRLKSDGQYAPFLHRESRKMSRTNTFDCLRVRGSLGRERTREGALREFLFDAYTSPLPNPVLKQLVKCETASELEIV